MPISSTFSVKAAHEHVDEINPWDLKEQFIQSFNFEEINLGIILSVHGSTSNSIQGFTA